MNVTQVGKDTVGIGHVLVDIIEIADKQLSPTIKLVKRLGGTRLLTKRLVEVANQLDRVCHLTGGLLAEQLADSDIGRAP